MSPRASSGLFVSAQTAKFDVCFRWLSSLPVSLIRQLCRSQLSRLTSRTAHVSTQTDSHRAVELTVLTATTRERGTVTETRLLMLTASGITADLICQIMTVSQSLNTDIGVLAKMTGDTRKARGGIEIKMMLRLVAGMISLGTEGEARQRQRSGEIGMTGVGGAHRDRQQQQVPLRKTLGGQQSLSNSHIIRLQSHWWPATSLAG